MTLPYEILCDSNEDRAQWLGLRKLGIGASEIAAVLGVSPWSSALKLWAEKTGRMEPDDLDDNEAVFWGTMLEGAIIEGYAKRTGRLVRPFGKLLRSTRWPWLLATPDAETSDDGGVTWWPLQIKNIGFGTAAHWENGAPDYYRAQVIHEALVYGATKTTAAALVAGQRLIWEDVQVDEITARQIVNFGREFWHQVTVDEEPKADGSVASTEAIKGLYPRERDAKVIVLPGSFSETDADLLDAKGRLKEIEAEIRTAENAIKQALGDAVIGVLPDGTEFRYAVEGKSRRLRRKAAKGDEQT